MTSPNKERFPPVYTMDESGDESRRLLKRRRVNGNTRAEESRYSSPDELAASSDHEANYARRASSSNHRELLEHRRRSYNKSDSDESPDELDHTVHTFYRGSKGTSRSESRSPLSRGTSTPTPRSRTPLEFKQTYTGYRQKLVLKGHRKGVAAVKFSPDGKCIASCCEPSPMPFRATFTDADSSSC